MLLQYPSLQVQYYDWFIRIARGPETWIESHQAEIAQGQAEFYRTLFSFAAQTGLYLILCVKGFSEFLRKKSQP